MYVLTIEFDPEMVQTRQYIRLSGISLQRLQQLSNPEFTTASLVANLEIFVSNLHHGMGVFYNPFFTQGSPIYK